VKQVIQTSDVMPYEQFGFTNCVRFKDVLYLSGVSALDVQGQGIGDDIETQTVHTFPRHRARAAGRREVQCIASAV
jgi:2-iminobutanoate/2-iminopropanoate deaminase